MKIQLAQIPSNDGVTRPNLARVLAVMDAAQADTDLIVFPETCLMGFPSADEVRQVAEPEHGETLQAVLRCVQARGISVVVGFAEADGGHYYNSTVLLSPEGIVLKYRKTHLWASDVGVFTPGQQLVTGLWKGIRVGILICFDIEFPENARALAQQGAELLLVTNANMDPFGPVHRALVIARAMENQVFAVMANRCGSDGGLTFAGESVAVSPTGRVIAALGRDEGTLDVCIDLAEVQASRAEYSYLAQRRIPLAAELVRLPGTQTALRIP